MEPETANQVLQRYVRDRSDEAFRLLVAGFGPMVHATALRVCGRDWLHLAEDAGQMAFMSLARNPGQVRHGQRLGGWLHRATSRAAVALIRREKIRRVREQHAGMNPSEPNKSWIEIAPVLDAGLNALAKADRELLVLRYLEQRDLGTVGKAFGISADAARMRVQRALEKLRAKLAVRGITTDAVTLGGVLAAPSEPVGVSLPDHLHRKWCDLAPVASAPISGFQMSLLMMTKSQILATGGVAVLLAAGLWLLPATMEQGVLDRGNLSAAGIAGQASGEELRSRGQARTLGAGEVASLLAGCQRLFSPVLRLQENAVRQQAVARLAGLSASQFREEFVRLASAGDAEPLPARRWLSGCLVEAWAQKDPVAAMKQVIGSDSPLVNQEGVVWDPVFRPALTDWARTDANGLLAWLTDPAVDIGGRHREMIVSAVGILLDQHDGDAVSSLLAAPASFPGSEETMDRLYRVILRQSLVESDAGSRAALLSRIGELPDDRRAFVAEALGDPGPGGR